MSISKDGHHVCDFDEEAQTCPWAEKLKAANTKRVVILPAGWTRTLEPHGDCSPIVVYDCEKLKTGLHNSHPKLAHVYVDAAFDEETDIGADDLKKLRAAMAQDSGWLHDYTKREGR